MADFPNSDVAVTLSPKGHAFLDMARAEHEMLDTKTTPDYEDGRHFEFTMRCEHCRKLWEAQVGA